MIFQGIHKVTLDSGKAVEQDQRDSNVEFTNILAYDKLWLQ